MTAFIKTLAVAIGLAVLISLAMIAWMASRGVSARGEPGAVERMVARTMRSRAIPRGDRDRPNPVEATADIVAAGMAHDADHCAACHGNGGGGEPPSAAPAAH